MRAVCALSVGNVPDCCTCCPTGTRTCCRTSKRGSGLVRLYPSGIFPTVRTFINNLSCWLDHWLQTLKQIIPSFLKDGDQLLQLLKLLGRFPPGSLLFTANAVSMYTNIHTDHAIEVISAWLDSLKDHLPAGYPINAVKEGIILVMKNTIVEWGDMYFL